MSAKSRTALSDDAGATLAPRADGHDPSHDRIRMSYAFSLFRSFHSVVASVKVPWLGKVAANEVAPLPENRLTRPLPPSVEISLSSIPILRTRQSSASALPVVIAIFGMWPSLEFFGSRVSVGSIGLSAHAVGAVAIVTCRRHLPICTTTGRLSVTGTSSRLK